MMSVVEEFVVTFKGVDDAFPMDFVSLRSLISYFFLLFFHFVNSFNNHRCLEDICFGTFSFLEIVLLHHFLDSTWMKRMHQFIFLTNLAKTIIFLTNLEIC